MKHWCLDTMNYRAGSEEDCLPCIEFDRKHWARLGPWFEEGGGI